MGLTKEDTWIIPVDQMVVMKNPTYIAHLVQDDDVHVAVQPHFYYILVYGIWMRLSSDEDCSAVEHSAKWLKDSVSKFVVLQENVFIFTVVKV